VQGTPLFQSIDGNRSSKGAGQSQLKARLGRLAWETVNAVVELTEQKRMETDREYAEAVLRLRTRTCIQEDVELFNTRVRRRL